MPHASQAEQIFLDALEKTTPEQRAAYLDEACANDVELRRHVEHLLEAHVQAGMTLDASLSAAEANHPGLSTTRALDRVPQEAVGTRIGPYKLPQTLGEGGMGRVYLAEQEQPLQRRVALKIIKAGMDSAQVIARFEQEWQALAMMDHPHIAKVLDAGTTAAGRPFFVMELVKGIPITQFSDQEQLTPQRRLELFLPVRDKGGRGSFPTKLPVPFSPLG